MEISETLISFTVAKLAKEKGCNIKGNLLYLSDGQLVPNFGTTNLEWHHAITQSMLQKWIREKHNCIIEVIYQFDEVITNNKIMYYSTVDYYGKNMQIELTNDSDYESPLFNTYEAALEKALKQALLLIN